MTEQTTVTREGVIREIEKVQDPCACASIMTLNLLRDVEVHAGGHVKVTYDLTSPFCPGMFAARIGADIKRHVLAMPGVKSVEVKVTDHLMADEINRHIVESTGVEGERIVLHDPFAMATSQASNSLISPTCGH